MARPRLVTVSKWALFPAAVINIWFLITFLFILYQPSRGPIQQRLGWQSYDVVSFSESNQTQIPLKNDTLPQDDDVEWWNVTQEQNVVDQASLPLDVWQPLLGHETGLTEITIVRCAFDPKIVYGNLCTPRSTPEDETTKGKWVRVERNLARHAGYFYLHMWYRRSRRLDVPLVSHLRLLPAELPDALPGSRDSWHRIPESVRDGVPGTPPLFLWYQLGPTLRDLDSASRSSLITELDVNFGDDEPWWAFQKLEPAVENSIEHKREGVWITYRRGVKGVPKAPPLHFSRDGRFKIMQVADLHFSVGPGDCREVATEPCSRSDNMTQTLVGRMLDEEKPNFVVFSGDQLNGQGTSWDAKSVLAKFAREVIRRKIPWAAVFGNHDEEGSSFPKDEQMRMMRALPYSLVKEGPKDVHGAGNYVLPVKSADASKTQLLTLYFLDSGAYSKGWFDFFGFLHPTEYDYLRKDQIDWFLSESAAINPIERPFTPDGARDLGHAWAPRDPQQVTPNLRHIAKPNALMFFHIPLQEAYKKADADPSKGNLPINVGLVEEKPGSAKKNEGFFDKALLVAKEGSSGPGVNVPEVKVVANGHCHVTENCKRVKNIYHCFGGGGSYSGYSKIGFDRRFRIYDISNYGETIKTYKRLEHGDAHTDEMILAGNGAPPYS